MDNNEFLVNKFSEINKKFEENGIFWFAHSGTLLGIIRHNGKMIPWDDDIDMSMSYNFFIKNREKIEKILNDLNCSVSFYKDNNTKIRSNIAKIYIDETKKTSIDIMFYLDVKNEQKPLYFNFYNFIMSSYGFLISEHVSKKWWLKIIRIIIPLWFLNLVIDKRMNYDLKEGRLKKNIVVKLDPWFHRKIFYDLNNDFIKEKFENTYIYINKNYIYELEKSYGKNWRIEKQK